MGTRADFYLGTGVDAEWLGSVGMDGYEWEENLQCTLMQAKTADDFRAAVAEIAKERSDWTSPGQGWPWPWDNSFMTDRTYAFADGRVCVFHWGRKPSENVCEWPDMSKQKNVTLGPRSGLLMF